MIAVCVGHSRPGDRGAVSVDGTSEWFYNSQLAELVAMRLDDAGMENEVYTSYRGKSYGSAMTWLAGELRSLKAEMAVELHFNSAAHRAAAGHEWLYSGSSRGRVLAQSLEAQMCFGFPDASRRGLVILRPKEDGGGFLHKTHCPAVICEPFFGSNPDDWERIAAHRQMLAGCIARGLQAAHEILTGKAA